MKADRGRIVLGLLLMLVGAFVLLRNLQLLPDLGMSGWSLALAMAAGLFILIFVSSGLRAWGWLFPVAAFGSAAMLMFLDERGVQGDWLGLIVPWSLAVPFWVGYLIERGREWWPVLPGGILTAVGFMPILAAAVRDEYVGAVFMSGLALIFALVYLASRRAHWWPLIPAAALAVAALSIVLVESASADIADLVFTLVLGAVFLAVFLLWRDQWWALIPAGMLVTSATVVALQLGFDDGVLFDKHLAPGVFFSGLALTFLVIWLLRGSHATSWAIYPALGLATLAALSVVLGPRTQLIWPLLLLAAGGWIVIRAFRPAAGRQ